MLCHVIGHVVLLRQFHCRVLIEALGEHVGLSSAYQRSCEGLGRTSFLLQNRAALNCLFHTIFSHLPPSGPLATSNESDVVGWMVGHDVVSGGRALVLGVGIAAERPDAVPGRHHVAPANGEIRVQILLTLVDQVLDFILWNFMVQVRLCLHVCGANKCVALPRDEEEEGATRRHHVNHADVARAVVWRQHNVGATRAVDNFLHIFALAHLAHPVSEWATAVNDLFAFDGKGFGIWVSLVNYLSTTSLAFVVEEDLFDFGVVRHASSMHCGCECNTQICPRIVVRTLVKD
mmetsp:Transcript_118031/g.220557  ORF Transcript_118031/g.220557 Transcript_118031/m.220557 type:complete len:290 (+) Transcript_118031:1067-1936(+)